MELSSRTLSISKKWSPIRVGLKQTEAGGGEVPVTLCYKAVTLPLPVTAVGVLLCPE